MSNRRAAKAPRLQNAPTAKSPKAILVTRRKLSAAEIQILDVATKEFAAHGFSGARIDRMATNLEFTKRMIYYYFKGKRVLYHAVLERSYDSMASYLSR